MRGIASPTGNRLDRFLKNPIKIDKALVFL
jgi:hypothetical protein